MNAQERDQLLQFLTPLQRTRVQPKDAVADGLIRQALAQGDTPYALVQRAMGLTLALQAAQARIAELQEKCDALAEPSAPPRLASAPTVAAAAPNAPAATSAWGQGLVRQLTGTAVGVATGVVAGGMVLQGLHSLLGEGPNVAPPELGSGRPDNLSQANAGDAGEGLWDLGDDWA